MSDVVPMRVAVVGAGVMGSYHANVYAALPDAMLVGVVEPDPTRRADAAERYGCATYADLDALLAGGPIEAVSVASPTGTHFDLVRRLLHAGVHVLVEKPVATSVVHARELAALSRARRLVLQVGHITRFFRAVEQLQEQVRAPYLIEARRLAPNGRIQDVGVVLDLMIHDIDIVLGLVDAPVVDVAVAGHTVGDGEHEDVCAAQVRFEGGCVARFLASRVAPDAERTLVVAEAHQTFRLDFGRAPHTEMAVYRPQRDVAEGSHVHVDRYVVYEDNPLRKELAHFLARVRGRTTPIGTLEDDLRSLTLATDLLTRLRAHRSALPSLP
ncbi:MAG: Gfo/Idh/MocA family oxidoreductase [Trueperaceae bacterium]